MSVLWHGKFIVDFGLVLGLALLVDTRFILLVIFTYLQDTSIRNQKTHLI